MSINFNVPDPRIEFRAPWDTKDAPRYIIRNIKTGLWWNDDSGWGDRDSAVRFSSEDRRRTRLPMEGEWVEDRAVAAIRRMKLVGDSPQRRELLAKWPLRQINSAATLFGTETEEDILAANRISEEMREENVYGLVVDPEDGEMISCDHGPVPYLCQNCAMMFLSADDD